MYQSISLMFLCNYRPCKELATWRLGALVQVRLDVVCMYVVVLDNKSSLTTSQPAAKIL